MRSRARLCVVYIGDPRKVCYSHPFLLWLLSFLFAKGERDRLLFGHLLALSDRVSLATVVVVYCHRCLVTDVVVIEPWTRFNLNALSKVARIAFYRCGTPA